MFKLLPFIYRGFKFENPPPRMSTNPLPQMQLENHGDVHIYVLVGFRKPQQQRKICCWTCKTILVWFFWWFLLVCFRDVSLLSDDSPDTVTPPLTLVDSKSPKKKHAVAYPFSANGVVFVLKKSDAILPLVDQEQTTMIWEYWSNIDVAEPRASWCGKWFWVLLWFTILWTPYEMGFYRQMCLKIINQQHQH